MLEHGLNHGVLNGVEIVEIPSHLFVIWCEFTRKHWKTEDGPLSPS